MRRAEGRIHTTGGFAAPAAADGVSQGAFSHLVWYSPNLVDHLYEFVAIVALFVVVGALPTSLEITRTTSRIVTCRPNIISTLLTPFLCALL